MVTRTRSVERKAQAPKRTQARLMRHDPKYCERLLWNELRDRKLDGFKFKRQHPIDKYIVDYVCLKRKLIVELDGGIHKLKAEEDAVRDAILQTFGYRVVRIQNEELVRDLATVILTIRHAL